MAKKKSSSAASKLIAKNIEKAIGQRSDTAVYQFKISLDHAHLPIWRRIQTTDVTLDDLHDQIQGAMGWENAHLYQFLIDKAPYLPPSPYGDDFGFEPAPVDSRKVLLSRVLTNRRKGFKFKYEYDFGDSWNHTVAYEGLVPSDAGAKYPRCIDGLNACPPEDVGGVWGYAANIEALTGPDEDERDEVLEWMGEFDPHEFDLAEADARMRPRRR